MSRYHIIVLQLLLTSFVCSHFFHSFAQNDASGRIFCLPYFTLNLKFKLKIAICNHMQQIIMWKKIRYMEGKRKKRGRKESNNKLCPQTIQVVFTD